MRMSGLCKVEMSAFIDGRGAYGNGANRLEPTRTGPIESVARGVLDQSDFYPFGGERVLSSASGNIYKFEGEERDAEANHDDFGAG